MEHFSIIVAVLVVVVDLVVVVVAVVVVVVGDQKTKKATLVHVRIFIVRRLPAATAPDRCVERRAVASKLGACGAVR